MKEFLDKVKFATARTLTRLMLKAMDDARLQIEAQAMRFVGAKLPPIGEDAPKVAERFVQNLHTYFDEFTTLVIKDTEIEPDSYDNLSLVDHDYLEAMIAMEGMVKQMREKEFKGAKSFQTRLETMFPNIRIDETNNPLDPEQIGDCFNEAIRPLGLKAHYLLTIYREFNKSVFGHYEDILKEANQVLIEQGVLPNLDINARERELRKAKRTEARTQLATEQKYKEEEKAIELANRGAKKIKKEAPDQVNSEMFAMMQTLIQSLAGKGENVPAATTSSTSGFAGSDEQASLAAQQEELRQQQTKLMGMLTEIQASILKQGSQASNGAALADAVSVGESINESLQAQTESGKLGSIGAQSGDVINLVTMLYEAIWKDRALSVVMKELIGRTQISIMKVALADTGFFDNENHPARALLNELALAGIAWAETDNLDNDPVYGKVKQLVERLLNESEPDHDFLQQLVDELRESTGAQSGTDAKLEKRVKEAEDFASNMDDVHAYVKQKVNARMLKGYLDPAIRNLLETHLHNFLVKLVVKEGPEGKSWKPMMTTIDVLIWTVQADKQPGDKERFNRINPRLLDNLGKALEIGGASKTKITKFMRQLKQIQEYSFHKAEFATGSAETASATATDDSPHHIDTLEKEQAPLQRNDPHLRRADKLRVGTWIEFQDAAGQSLRCTLASKIDSIDKMFFANSEGKKVVEMTQMTLAQALKAGTAKIISEGSLVNRAMNSVINDLKESAAEDDHSSAQDVAAG